MTNPKPISLTQVAEGAYDGREKPQEFLVVGSIPGGGGGGGGGAVSSVNSKTGDVVLAAADVGAAPTSHTHSIADVEDLQQTLDGKADRTQIVVLGVLDHDETPPSAGVWLRRPAP